MSTFSIRRIIAVSKKEIYHILRDPYTLVAALGLPIFMVIVFGYAIEFNVKNIPLAVSDASQTRSSRQLVQTFASSGYFLPVYTDSTKHSLDMLTSEEVRAALVIPPGIERDILGPDEGKLQILLDGSDNSTVGPILGYVGNIQRIATRRIAEINPSLPYETRTRFLFNPELSSQWFIIPGLNVVVMGIISVLLTSLTIAREYEFGSMELLLSTPIRPIEIIIGKLAPYGALGVASVVIICLLARFVFLVPFIGSYSLFAIGAVLFLIAYLAQGLLVSVVTRDQAVAMQVAMMIGMLPTIYFSGFIFPIESMPQVLQYFTALFPARWFMEISRDTFLKGTGFSDLAVSFLGLSLFVVFIVGLATRRFKRDLEP